MAALFGNYAIRPGSLWFAWSRLSEYVSASKKLPAAIHGRTFQKDISIEDS
jgi:hypothetical protein